MIMMDRSNFDCVEFIVLLGTLEKNDFTVDFRMKVLFSFVACFVVLKFLDG